jgi:replicative DNA helicase
MRPLPYDQRCEECVAGAVLYDCTLAMEILVPRRITPDHFHVAACRHIYEAAVEMWNAGRNVDLLTAGTDLQGKVEHEYLLQCVEAMPTLAHLGDYADTLQDLHVRRQLIRAAHDMEDQAYDMEADAEELRSVLELRLSSLCAKRDTARTPAVILEDQARRWDMARERKCIGLQTGFTCIDYFLGGLMESAFIVISGQAKSCKTTLARNILENVAMRGIRASLLSIEQTADQIWGACAARMARQSVFRLNNGHRSADVEAVRAVAADVSRWPLEVEDRPHTLSEACSWIRREVGKGSRVIVIDYLQRIIPDKHMLKSSDEAQIRAISTTLANMAKETKIPIIAISSLSRAGHLRGSGQIDYDVYAALRMERADHPEDYSKRWTLDNLVYALHFDSQRFGPPAETQYLTLLGDEGRLSEPEREARHDSSYHQENY